jgi:hypothetical protein
MKLVTLIRRTLARVTGRASAANVPGKHPFDPVIPRGSGSWEMTVPDMTERPRTKAARRHGPPAGPSETARPDGPSVVTELAPADDLGAGPLDDRLQARSLMTRRERSLHNWIVDRLEAAAPTCTLHAGVALEAFLATELQVADAAPLAGLRVDLLIVDERTSPVVALSRRTTADQAIESRVREALSRAQIPFIELDAQPQHEALWLEIDGYLPPDG